MEVSLWQLVLGIVAIIGTMIVNAVRISFQISEYVSEINKQILTIKAEFNALLELKEAETGKSIGRVYQRFDEYKQHLEESYVRREMCSLLHDSTAAKLTEFNAISSAKFAELTKKIDSLGDKTDALILKVAQMK